MQIRPESHVLLILICGSVLIGCATKLPSSYTPSKKSALEAGAVCSEARLLENTGEDPKTGVHKAIRCADTLAHEYVTTADNLASHRQNFRYVEVALATLTLGLAGFEAHGDTLKAAGLATGTTTVLKSGQQYADRIATLQKASMRFRCVVDNSRAAQTAQTRLKLSMPARKGLSTGRLLLDGASDEDKLLGLIIDTIGNIEQTAQSGYSFSEQPETPATAIDQAIKDAIALGRELNATRVAVLGTNARAEDKSMELIRLEQAAEVGESLIKIAACAAI